MRGTGVVVALGLVALAAGFGAGCKTDCEKAYEHLASCMELACREQPEVPDCAQLESLKAELRAQMPEACTGLSAERSRRLLEMPCEDIEMRRFRPRD